MAHTAICELFVSNFIEVERVRVRDRGDTPLTRTQCADRVPSLATWRRPSSTVLAPRLRHARAAAVQVPQSQRHSTAKSASEEAQATERLPDPGEQRAAGRVEPWRVRRIQVFVVRAIAVSPDRHRR